MKVFKLLLFLSVLFSLNPLDLYSQYLYKPVPTKYLARKYSMSEFNKKEAELLKTNFDLTGLLPANFVKDGSVDYTRYVQKGLDNYSNVIFPNFPILINEKGLTVKGNSNLVFANNSKLLMKGNSLDWYEVIRIHNVQNVNIFNPVIIGDREHHKAKSGEWGMGIAIRGSQNINIINPVISKCWGDGIDIGAFKEKPSINITILNAKLDYNRRNGIALGSAQDIKIINALISNTYGTLPMAGICIEPNSNRDICNNISIINPITFNNAKAGIQIGLAKLPGILKKQANIIVENHLDDGSLIGFYMGGFNQSYKNGNALGGEIQINNSIWNDNRNSFKSGINYDFGPSIVIKNMKIKNKESYQNAISVKNRINQMHKKLKIE